MIYSIREAPKGRVYRVKEIKGGSWSEWAADFRGIEWIDLEKSGGQLVSGVMEKGGKVAPNNFMMSWDFDVLLETVEEEEEERFRHREEYVRALNSRANLGGSDPEVFVEKADGEVLPAWEFLPPRDEARGGPYWDGFQAEFNTPPKACIQQQVDGVREMLRQVWQRAAEKESGAKLSFRSAMRVKGEVLAGARDEHVALGCKPSLNAWGLEGMPVLDARSLEWRFAGGHIHQEVQGLTPLQAERTVRGVDRVVGIPSLLMFQKMDHPIRRQFYGLPGEHRLPAHGLEWRFLSNAWLCHPAIAHFVLNLTRIGVRAGLKGLEDLWEASEERVMRVLVEGDLDEARRMVKGWEGVYRRVMEKGVEQSYRDSFWRKPQAGESKKVLDASIKLLESPVGEFVPLESMEENWRLGKDWTVHCGSPGCMWQTLVLGKATPHQTVSMLQELFTSNTQPTNSHPIIAEILRSSPARGV